MWMNIHEKLDVVLFFFNMQWELIPVCQTFEWIFFFFFHSPGELSFVLTNPLLVISPR